MVVVTHVAETPALEGIKAGELGASVGSAASPFRSTPEPLIVIAELLGWFPQLCGSDQVEGTLPMRADERKCPRCAETIKIEASVCKHCRHEFPEAEIARERVRIATAKEDRALDKALRESSSAASTKHLKGGVLLREEAEGIAAELHLPLHRVLSHAALREMNVEEEDVDDDGDEGSAALERPPALAKAASRKRTSSSARLIKCSICRTAGIEWGAQVCTGCGAEITYPFVNSNDGDAKAAGWIGGIAGFLVALILAYALAGLLPYEAGPFVAILGVALILLGVFLGRRWVQKNDPGVSGVIPVFQKPRRTSVGVIISSGDG